MALIQFLRRSGVRGYPEKPLSYKSSGTRILALVVHERLLLLTSGRVRLIKAIKDRERLRLRGAGWYIADVV